jgi:hypothetical protein
MMARKKVRDYSLIKFELPEKIEPCDRIIINVSTNVDFSVFHKTPEEKQRLKDAKHGIVKKRRCRPGKEHRERLYLRKQGLISDLSPTEIKTE